MRIAHGGHAHEVEIDHEHAVILVDGTPAADLAIVLGIAAEITCERRSRAAAKVEPEDGPVSPDV
jgi:hypothetical protein